MEKNAVNAMIVTTLIQYQGYARLLVCSVMDTIARMGIAKTAFRLILSIKVQGFASSTFDYLLVL